MAPGKRPCTYFQLGKCNNGVSCNYAHVIDPTVKRKACQHFMKGRCTRGKDCNFSHERDDIDHLKIANGATGTSDRDLQNSEARLKEFRWKIPKQTTGARPLDAALGKFFQQALELVDGEIGTMQEVITLLTSDGGLLRVDELLQQPFNLFSPAQLTRAIDALLLPFFKIFTHANVVSSVLLRGKVMTVYNIIYTGDGSGTRAIELFTALATHFSDSSMLGANPEGSEINRETIGAIDSTLAVLAKVIEINTPAHTNPGFVPIVAEFAALLSRLPESAAFAMSNARKNLNKLQQRLGIAQALPGVHDTQRPTGTRATFELAREMPGELSEEGCRHDNDHVDIRDISILPTLQEIQSSRNEYLPVADPRQWHFGGIPGLVDRHFRLLREDTVGQLRDAAKFELERLQNPHHLIDRTDAKTQGARTRVYDDAYIASIDFDGHHGVQVALGFTPPEAKGRESKTARKQWWDQSKRLGPDALICLLSSEGSAIFFVVSPQAQKPTQLQKEFDLASDPDLAYVVAKPVNQSDLHELLSRALGDDEYTQLSIVEFPGVLLPAFEPTLKAMQRISETLDMPFPHILAPVSTPENPDREIEVQPPTYATKPGFKYDLSTITIDNESLHFAPSNSIMDVAAQLARKSTLDLGQARAVVSSLAHSIALIQGPPGTGKSYTGVQLVRVAPSNKSSTNIGPILVCTQTNHALDAILERSVDDGVSNIVRIGGRSKSERLEDVNLRVLSQRLDLTKTEKSARWELNQKLKTETAEIGALISAFDAIGSQSAVEAHLLQNHPWFHMQMFGDTDEDGFIEVKHKRGTTLDVWLTTGLPGSRRATSTVELRSVLLYEMTNQERRVIFESWMVEISDELHAKLRHALSSYNEIKEKLDVIRTELNLRVLRQANIIGITTSGLARNLELLRGVNSKILICEEAGEILEAHLLTALLPSIEHCMLIGDHQQLRPQVQNFDLSSESRNGGQYALDISLFERLVQPQDMFAQRLPLSTLEVQRRMHPSISQLVKQTQYPHLKDDASVSTYPKVVGMRRRLFWMHHDKPEDDNSDGHSTSRTNEHEVGMIAALVKHLVQQGAYKPSDIAVITPYLGQLRKLRQRFSSSHTIMLTDRDIDELAKEDSDPDETAVESAHTYPHTAAKGSLSQALRLATVDNFQGEEAKVIVVSLVRSNKKNNPGFLKTPNRINVLLSRAQHGMYIIGNANTTASVPMWHDVMEIFRNDDNMGEAIELACPRHPDTPMLAQNAADFARLSPEAGCNLPCEKQLECGHACIAKCHSDMLHGAVYCLKTCTKPKKSCEHLCPKPCGDRCDEYCRVPMEESKVELSCGHVKTDLLCYEFQDPAIVVCKEPVKQAVPGCHHEIVKACHINVDRNEFECTTSCGDVLACGHICKKPCYQCKIRVDGEISKIDHGKCMQKCDRDYNTCKHRCESSCHSGSACPLCTTNCDTSCSHAHCGKRCSEFCSPCLEEQCSSGIHCPHTDACPMPCAAPCTWVPCSERCDKLLSCGCRCPSVCGEDCPSATFCQEHGSEDVKAMQADLLMFTPYKDINLDTDPCIFTPCGHIFTIDSLDGTMGMQDHYEVDPLTGNYTGLKSSSEPFSIEDSKPCPECRGSLRNVARYGRIVRRALLDESAKKLTAWSNSKHQDLANRLVDLEGDLMKSLDFKRKPKQVVALDGSVTAQVETVKKLKTTKRYRKMYMLIREITNFEQKLSKDEQPYQRVHDLVETARRQSTWSDSIAKFEFSSEELQLREHLQASNLLSRSYLILLGDVMSVHEKTDVGMRGSLRVDFTANRVLCEKVIAEAVESKNIRQEAEAHVLWAKFAAMECGILEQAHDEVDHTGQQHRADVLKAKTIERLQFVEQKCAQRAKSSKAHNSLVRRNHPDLASTIQEDPMRELADEAAEVRRMLREGLSSSEMRMVVTAMTKEFGGTGHWYRCANGHPFTVGECGMPMQLARCPECGAGVGGQNHQSTAGVTQARDIDAEFGRLAL